MRFIGFLFFVLVIGSCVLLFVSYSRLAKLHINLQELQKSLLPHIEKIAAFLSTMQDTAKDELAKQRFADTAQQYTEAETTNEKIACYNQFIEITNDNLLDLPKDAAKDMQATLAQRRYYNHETKRFNALLHLFPSNLFGKLLSYGEQPLFTLLLDEQAGEHADVSWK